MGSTWLTVFPGETGPEPDSSMANMEFAIEVGSPEEVDRLYEAFVAAGVNASGSPMNTIMYERMRFAYVDDPFGARIDIYCLLPGD